jgi:hypothetical protein
LQFLLYALFVTVGAIVEQIEELIKTQAPKGTSPLKVLEKAVHSFLAKESNRIGENEAKAALLARGALARAKLEQADGGAVSGEAVADLLGMKRQGVDYLRKTKGVLAWRRTRGKWHYPVWQFSDGQVRPGIRECLKALPNDDSWSQMIFFLSARQSLNEQRPLDLLYKGEIDKAVAAAKRHDRHGAH